MRIEWIAEERGGFLGQLSTDRVLELQQQMNRDIRALQVQNVPNLPNQLTEDGVAGDATCSVGRFLNDFSPQSTPYPVAELCQMAADRKRGGGAPPPPREEPPPSPPVTGAAKKKKSNWGLALLGAAAVIAGVYALA